MRNRYILFCILSLFFAGICYLVTLDLICSGIVLLLFICFFLLISKKLNIYFDECSRFHETYHFINSFLISLSVKGSIIEAIDASKISMSDKFNECLNGLNEMNENEKLNYLKSYFNFRIYEVFLNIVTLWQDQGGDIIDYSYFLINEAKNNEEYLIACERINKRKIIEFSSLWILSLTILIILRFSLYQFYNKISSQLFFKIAIIGFYVIILLSLLILVNKMTEMKLKGNCEYVTKK